MGNVSSDNFSLLTGISDAKKKSIPCGTRIMVISGFRNNRGQKSADLVISEPRKSSSSILSELGLFDFWILIIPRTKNYMSPLPTLYLV